MTARAHARNPQVTADLIPPAARHRARPTFSAHADVIDAEFEEITATVARPQPAVKDAFPGTTASPLRRVRDRPTAFSTAPPPSKATSPFAVLAVALSLLSFWICGGGAFVSRVLAHPASASLSIAGVSSRVGLVDGLPVALVNGHVRNATSTTLPVPPIEIRTANGAHGVIVHPAAAELRPGQSIGFRARLPVPSGRTNGLSVAFASTN